MQIEQEIIKRKKIIMPLFVIIFILSSFVFVKFLLNRMNTYIEVNGEISMEAVVEQIQQTYDMQVSGYYRQLHFVEGYLCKEKKISLETENNRIFFNAWEKESESTLLFLQENGKAITSDGTKLKVDMPSKLLLDLRNGSNIGKLVALEFEQVKKDGYLVAIPCQEYTINGETYTAIGTVYDHSKLDSMLNLGGYDGSVASYPHSVFTSWMGIGIGYDIWATVYLYVCILLAALPYCSTFVKDNNSQYILQYYSRISKNRLHIAKFITTFVVGGLIVVIPLLVNLIATMMFVPALKPIENGLFMGNGSSFMNALFVRHTFIYTIVYILQYFIYGGAFSVIALAASYIFSNSFLVMLTPFVVFYGLGVVSNMLRNMFGTESFNPMRLLASNMLSDKQLAAYILEPVIITVISGIIFFVKGADNEAL